MKEGCKISVIIPVYNAQDHIGEALESCEMQDIDSLEIICINDGSSDRSLEIIKEYERRLNHFIVIDKGNEGAASARNLGLAAAGGEYIAFLDADDCFAGRDSLSRMYDTAKSGGYQACAGFLQVVKDGVHHRSPFLRDMAGLWEETGGYNYEDFQFDYHFWCYIYKRRYLEEKGIRFPGLKTFEDPPFLVSALYFAGVIGVCPVEYYCYRAAKEERTYHGEMFTDLLRGIGMNIDFARTHRLPGLLQQSLQRLNHDFYDALCDGLDVRNPWMIRQLFLFENAFGDGGIHLKILRYLISLGMNADLKKCKMLSEIEPVVPRNCKLVLYAAGDIGTRFYEGIRTIGYCNLVAWVDKYKEGASVLGERIRGMGELKKLNYDYILIAIRESPVALGVCNELINMGIEKEKILLWGKSSWPNHHASRS